MATDLFYDGPQTIGQAEPIYVESLHLYLTQATPYDEAKAGVAIAEQRFGDFQNLSCRTLIMLEVLGIYQDKFICR